MTSMVAIFGLLDCFTTVAATGLFGAKEVNPLMAFIININWQTFAIVKIAVTVCVCLTLLYTDKLLATIANTNSKSFRLANVFVKTALIGLVSFMFVTVLNNSIVLSHLI